MRKLTCLLLGLLTLASCGLPNRANLFPPTAGGVQSARIEFITPDDVTLITGYNLYYKFYLNEGDDSNDVVAFRDSTKEIIPQDEGFIRMGSSVDTAYTFPLIPAKDVGSQQSIFIDFGNRDANNDPVVRFGSSSSEPENYSLRRGVYALDTSSPFLRFTEPLSSTDPDLRSTTSVSRSNDVQEVMESLEDNKSILGDGVDTTNVTRVYIGLVGSSYGLDLATLEPLNSVPVYLGKVAWR